VSPYSIPGSAYHAVSIRQHVKSLGSSVVPLSAEAHSCRVTFTILIAIGLAGVLANTLTNLNTAIISPNCVEDNYKLTSKIVEYMKNMQSLYYVWFVVTLPGNRHLLTLQADC